MMHPIDKAAQILGTQSKLAAKLGVSRAAVGQWRLPGRQVPAEHCPTIEHLTEGRVRCEELRPDVDWAYLRRKECCRENKPNKNKLYATRKRKTA
jgi:DNA-binding transcriptional regulator YdaS (Cro superfamily)